MPRPVAAVPAGDPRDVYVEAASTRACLMSTLDAAPAVAAFARYLDARDLAAGAWQQLSARYADDPAIASRVRARAKSCQSAQVLDVARYEHAFGPTLDRVIARVHKSRVVARTGRHPRDHSRHERQVGGPVGARCPELASAPVAGQWWRRPGPRCPAGSTPVSSQDGTACFTPDRRLVGVRASVYGNNRPSSYTSYCDGVKHGPAVYFGLRGHKRSEGNFHRGEKHGVWRTYYKTGELKDEVGYRDGQFHGEDKYWDRAGRLVRVKRWRDGQHVE